MKKVSLGFVVKWDEVLLAMKKRGFGAWFWNGAGWKMEEGETMEESFIREIKEELWLTISESDFEKVWINNFYYGDNPDGNFESHVFVVHSYEDEPVETEEMAPKWFKFWDIPYAEMWADDKIWLPVLLSWAKDFEYDFFFDENNDITGFEKKA